MRARLLALVLVVSASAWAGQAAAQHPARSDRAALMAAFKSEWGGSLGWDGEFADLQRDGRAPGRPRVRYLHLRPRFLAIRVSQTNPHLASMAVQLRDPKGGAGLPRAIVVFRKVRRRWEWTLGPDTAFPDGCTSGTAAGLRELVCPDPWTALGLPAPPLPSPGPVSIPNASANIRSVRWRRLALPGFLCGANQTIRMHTYGFVDSEVHPWWPRVEADVLGVSYGDLDGDGREEAAVRMVCTNAGGTTDGQISFVEPVFTLGGGSLQMIGEIVPQQPLDVTAAHVPALGATSIGRGRIAVGEAWYGSDDSPCCPTGRATSTWQLQAGTLQLLRTVVHREPGGS